MGKKHISVPKPGAAENSYYNRAAGLLNAGATGLSEGAYQQNSLAPYLYNLAGLDVQYDDSNQKAYQDDTAAADAAKQNLTDLNASRGNHATRQALLAKLAADPTFASLLTKKGRLKGGKATKTLTTEYNARSKAAQNDAAAPLRIKSITESPAAAAQRQREAQLLETEQGDLKKSLSMNADDVLAADPALKQQLEQEQAKLEQSQVNQFGTLASAGSGTIGAVQNAAMAQNRAAAISNARRENIGLYQGLQTQQNQQNNANTAFRGQMGALPGALAEDSAMKFGQLSSGYAPLIAGKAAQRQMQFQANSFNQTQPGIGEKILSGIGGLLQPFKNSGGS